MKRKIKFSQKAIRLNRVLILGSILIQAYLGVAWSLPLPPNPPINCSEVAPTGDDNVTIKWTREDPLGNPITFFKFYRNSDLLAVGINDGCIADAGNYCDATESSTSDGVYTYKVEACNPGGCSGTTCDVAVSVMTLSAPTGLYRDSSVLDPDVRMAWDDQSGATYYELYRDGWNVQNPATNSAFETLPDGTYSYYVKACNDGGCSGASGSVNVYIDDTHPPAPDNFQATSHNLYNTLTWDSSSDASGIFRYMVYKDGALLQSTTLLTINDTAVEACKTYRYSIVAVDNSPRQLVSETPREIYHHLSYCEGGSGGPTGSDSSTDYSAVLTTCETGDGIGLSVPIYINNFDETARELTVYQLVRNRGYGRCAYMPLYGYQWVSDGGRKTDEDVNNSLKSTNDITAPAEAPTVYGNTGYVSYEMGGTNY